MQLIGFEIPAGPLWVFNLFLKFDLCSALVLSYQQAYLS